MQSRRHPGDILVWQGMPPNTTPHSAILSRPDIARGIVQSSTRLRTKNGMMPEANLSLEQLIEIYGESYNVYERRQETLES
jgi:hypothetical protein